MSKLDNNLKPGVTKTDFYITLTTGLVTTGVSVLGLIDGEWAVIIVTALTSIWTFIRSRIVGKKKPNDTTVGLLLLTLISLTMVSCANDSNHAVTYTSGDYVITISKQGSKTVVVQPTGK